MGQGNEKFSIDHFRIIESPTEVETIQGSNNISGKTSNHIATYSVTKDKIALGSIKA